MRNLRSEQEIMKDWEGDLSRPLVSISCLAYNHENFIEDALEGFLTQETDFPFEILIHDDASTDRTADIIREYEAKYPNLIKPIYQTENQFSKNGNTIGRIQRGRARGKYMALCEGDDYWIDPLKLQKQVDFLNANPDYVICYHNSVVVNEHNNIIKDSRLSDSKKRDYSSDELIKANKIITGTMCYRNVIKDPPDEYYSAFGKDKFLISLLGAYGKGKYLSDVKPSAFRIHSGGVNSGDEDINLKHQKHLSTRMALYQYYKRIGMKAYSDYFLKEMQQLQEKISGQKSHKDKFIGKIQMPMREHIFGMTSLQEQAYFEHYTSQIYTGTGDIVDLGSWMGATTISLARGLAKRTDLDKSKRIHAFDRFVWKESWDKFLLDCKYKYKDGDSFLHEFKERISQWDSLIQIYAGDLMTMKWHGGPIEFLLIDAMKSWDAANVIQQTFFPFLIPNKSYVVHQDFKHYYTSWVHLLMYRLRSHFEMIYNIEKSGSIIFLYKEPIESQHFQKVYSFDDFSKQEIDNAFDYSMSLVPQDDRPNIAAAKVMLFIHLKDYKSARLELNYFISQGFPSKSNDLEKVIQKLNKNNIASNNIVVKYYQGDNAETYESTRKENPKWQFENDVLDSVLDQYKTEIKSIIDAPVGTGRFIQRYSLLDGSITVHGIDYSEDMLKEASHKKNADKMIFSKEDLINNRLSINADLVICYRFLNLVKWQDAEKILNNLFNASNKYFLFAIRVVGEDYTGVRYIEDKIHLHNFSDVDKVISKNNFQIARVFEFPDEKAGEYKIILCSRTQEQISARINKNFKVVYDISINDKKEKFFQVANNAHAEFIKAVTNESNLSCFFPEIKQITDDFISVEWVNGELLKQDNWLEVVDILNKIHSQKTTLSSDFDYVEDLIIPRFYLAVPIVGRDFYNHIVERIISGSSIYERKISHPDLIPGNVIDTGKGIKVIDNELMCYSKHYYIDLLNMLFNLEDKIKSHVLNKITIKYPDLIPDAKSHFEYLSNLWLARQMGSYIIKEKINSALTIYRDFQEGKNILPFSIPN